MEIASSDEKGSLWCNAANEKWRKMLKEAHTVCRHTEEINNLATAGVTVNQKILHSQPVLYVCKEQTSTNKIICHILSFFPHLSYQLKTISKQPSMSGFIALKEPWLYSVKPLEQKESFKLCIFAWETLTMGKRRWIKYKSTPSESSLGWATNLVHHFKTIVRSK